MVPTYQVERNVIKVFRVKDLGTGTGCKGVEETDYERRSKSRDLFCLSGEE